MMSNRMDQAALACFVLALLVSPLPLSADGPTYVSGTLDQDTIWTPADSPYVVTGGLFVPAGITLTIDAGTIVKFQSYQCQIYVNGRITANGTSASPIYFTSIKDDTIGGDTNGDGSATLPQPGDWSYILIENAGAEGSFNNSVFRYGGYSSIWPCALGCVNGASLSVSNSSILDNRVDGIDLNDTRGATITGCTFSSNSIGVKMDGCPSPSLTGNVFTDNSSAAAVMIGTVSGSINWSGNSGSGSAINGLDVTGTISGEAELIGSSGLPFVIESLWVAPGATLRVRPGVVLKFGSGGSNIHCNGSIVAGGNPSMPIYFTSFKDDSIRGDTNGDGSATSPAPGNWSYVLIDGGSGSFEYCIVKYGGNSGTWPCAVGCVGGGRIEMTGCEIRESHVYGVQCESCPEIRMQGCTISYNITGLRMLDCSSPTIIDCVFTGNTSAAATLGGTLSGTLEWYGNSGSGNQINGLAVSITTSGAAGIRGASGLPFVVDAISVPAGSTLNIDPGAVLKFGGFGSYIYVNGSLSAVGSPDGPIYFTSIRDDSVRGDTNNDGGATLPAGSNWSYILAENAGAALDLRYCVVRYGGFSGAWPCAVGCANGASISIRNCTVADNKGRGVYSLAAGAIITNSIFVANWSYGVDLPGGSASVAYCDFWQNNANNFGPNATLIGNMELDPMFQNFAAGDYNLRGASPCIDAGDPAMTDPDGTRIDMGALPSLLISPAQAKAKGDGEPAGRTQGVVTAVFPDFFYIEATDRSSGIRVDMPGHGRDLWQKVVVAGTVETDPANDERYIAAETISSAGSATVDPIGMPGILLGGGDWRYDPATGAGQKGMTWGFGLNNIGLLARTWGRVTEHEAGQAPGWFILEDGSHFATLNEIIPIKVKVLCPSGVGPPAVGQYVLVTGMSSSEKRPDGGLDRLLRTRRPEDIQVLE